MGQETRVEAVSEIWALFQNGEPIPDLGVDVLKNGVLRPKEIYKCTRDFIYQVCRVRRQIPLLSTRGWLPGVGDFGSLNTNSLLCLSVVMRSELLRFTSTGALQSTVDPAKGNVAVDSGSFLIHCHEFVRPTLRLCQLTAISFKLACNLVSM